MNKQPDEMTKDELAAECVRLQAALEAERQARQADRASAATALTAARSEHQQQARGLEEELRQSRRRARHVEGERDATRAECAVLRSANSGLAADLAKAKRSALGAAKQRDSARGWNVGLGLAAFVMAVR